MIEATIILLIFVAIATWVVFADAKAQKKQQKK